MSLPLAALFLAASPHPQDLPLARPEPPLDCLAPSYPFGDFDGDGRSDVLVLDPVGAARLFRNGPDARFEDVTAEHGLDRLERVTVALWFDCDGDQAADLFLAHADGRGRLFQNTGSGHFVDVTEAATLQSEGVIVSAESVDLDGDGALDVHLVGEFGDSLLRNLGRGRFERIALPGSTWPGTELLAAAAAMGAEADGVEPDASENADAADAERSPTARLAASLLRRRAALAASLAAAGAPTTTPNGGAGSNQPLFAACPFSLDDAGSAGPGCITASTVPTLGALYPLTADLFVTTTGRVGIGTTSPGNKLQVVSADTTVASIVGSSQFGTYLDIANGGGGRRWSLLSAGSGNGEGAGSFAIHDSAVLTTRFMINAQGKVGIGTTAPTSRLHVADGAPTPLQVIGSNSTGTHFDLANTSTGGDTWSLISTGSNSSEGAGKLLLRDSDTSTVALTLQPDGKVGIGTPAPSERLEVRAADPVIRVQNTNDVLGAFLGDTWSCVQLGMVNPSANPIGAVPANTRLSMFGMDSSGKVGSLTNALGQPSFRNVLDDGSGEYGFQTSAGSVGSMVGTAVHVTPAAGASYGLRVYGLSQTLAHVAGHVISASGGGYGVFGRTDSTGGYGTVGQATPVSGTAVGVHGQSNSPNGWGVYSTGNSATSGTKSFIQPHPTDASKEIRFVCLEGNESGTYFRGSGKLSNGYAVIDVPEDFRLVSESEGLTTQVTAVGGPAFLWVESESLDRIVVRGNVDVKFHYFVNGVRRGYADFETIAENHGYVPAVRGVPYGTQYPEAVRRILVDNGILNPDFTPNEATAARLGWKLVDKDSGEAAVHGFGPSTSH